VLVYGISILFWNAMQMIETFLYIDLIGRDGCGNLINRDGCGAIQQYPIIPLIDSPIE
jgi:hypothetical protein